MARSAHSDLVVKLYKRMDRQADTARRQFDALARRTLTVDGKTVDGWKTRAPLPLYASASPPALVMTMAAGLNLSKSLLTEAIAFEMLIQRRGRSSRLCGRTGRRSLHGDLSLNNILWDPADRVLSLIDVDTTSGASSAKVPRSVYPASLDWPVSYDVGTISDRRPPRRRVSGCRREILLAFLTTWMHRRKAEADRGSPRLARAELRRSTCRGRRADCTAAPAQCRDAPHRPAARPRSSERGRGGDGSSSEGA